MICSNCSKQLSDVAGICPYCGYAVIGPPAGSGAADDPLSLLNARIERNRRRRESLPQDERTLKIISDFEIRTDVVFKPAQTPKVYQARQTYNPEPLYSPARVSPAVTVINILLSLLLPPVGLIRAIVILAGKDRRLKDLGAAMLILSALLIVSGILVILVSYN